MNEELKIKISAQIAEAQKNIKAIQNELEGVGNKGSSAGEKLKGAFSKMASATGQALKVTAKAATALTAAAAAGVVAITKAAIDGFAEYEQLVGGVETLFKNSADKVQEYAANAYKTAGLSANEYMETVTSFSASLIASLGGDTAAAAEYANMAITDMSDNANKMGTSIESIQNAYQGFAKQNYTMLDNLKLGYGGTKEEMARLLADAEKLSGIKYDISSYADIVDAIHVVQTEMGITGTTAAEAASTINGSIGMMKSSWQNLITGIANENANFEVLIQNFVDSIGAVATNLLPRIEVALGGVASLIEQLLPALLEKIPPLITNLLPKVVSAAVGIVQALVNVISGGGFNDILNAVISAIPALLSGIISAIQAIVQALPSVLNTLLTALTTLLPDLINGVLGLVIMLCENIGAILQPIIDTLPTLIVNIIDALVANLPALIDGAITLVLAIVEALPEIYLALVEEVPSIYSSIIEALLNCLPQLIVGIVQLVAAIVAALPQILGGIVEAVIGIAIGAFDGVCNAFAGAGDWFTTIFDGCYAAITSAFDEVGEWAIGIWNKITSALEAAPEWFSSKFGAAWDGIKNAFGDYYNYFSNIWDNITGIFGNIAETIGNAITNTVKTAVNGVLSTACKIINGFISAINVAIGVINAIPGVSVGYLNKLSVPAMAKGGVVDSATLALIGEQGKEMVLPLENNLEYLDKLAGLLAERMGGSGTTKLYLQVDKKTLGEVTISGINDITKQTGNLPLLLV